MEASLATFLFYNYAALRLLELSWSSTFIFLSAIKVLFNLIDRIVLLNCLGCVYSLLVLDKSVGVLIIKSFLGDDW